MQLSVYCQRNLAILGVVLIPLFGLAITYGHEYLLIPLFGVTYGHGLENMCRSG